MNDQHERLLRAFLNEDASGAAPPDLLNRALAKTAVARRRPRWYARLREDALGPWMPAAGRSRVRAGAWVAVALLLVVLLLGAVVVGSRLLRPAQPLIDLLTYSTVTETDTDSRTVMYVVESGEEGDKLVGTPLDGASCGRFSPDAAHLAYQTLPGIGGTSRYQIVVAEADGSEARPIGKADVRGYVWQWSGDGTRIFYSTTLPGHLAFMAAPVDGGQPVEVVALRGALGAVWSPDGHRVAVVRPNVEGGPWTELMILVGDADGSNLQPVASFPDPHQMLGYSVAWSPDGRFLAYRRYPVGAVFPADEAKTPAWDIFAVGVDGSENHALTSTPAVFEGDIAWSPDSRRLAYSGADLRTTTLDGRTTVVLASGAAGAAAIGWSQDGGSIVFVRPGDKSATDTISVVRADGTEAPADLIAMPDPAAHVECLDVRPVAR